MPHTNTLIISLGRLVPMLVLILFLIFATSFKLNGNSIRSDALENVVASYHLWTTGTISLDGKTPSYFREPLPILIGAAHLALFTDIPRFNQNEYTSNQYDELGRASQATLNYPTKLMESKSNRIQISQLNLYYVFACLLAVWWLTSLLLTTQRWAAFAVVLSWLFFYYNYYYLYRPLTEYPASLFILIASGLMVKILRQPSLKIAILIGFSLGLLALVKASTLYVSVIASVILLLGVYSKNGSIKLTLTCTCTILVGILLVVAPWMLRNANYFDDIAITQRGGGGVADPRI